MSEKEEQPSKNPQEEEADDVSSYDEGSESDDEETKKQALEYEKLRQERINRNQQLLETLGLKQTIALSLTPTKPANNSQVFDEGTPNSSTPSRTRKRKEAPESLRTSSRISTNKRKSNYKEQEEIGGKQLEEEILALVVKRSQGKIQKPKFLAQLHDRFPKEIMIEKLFNLTKPQSEETVEYINDFLVPIMYHVTYEDEEYLSHLCDASEKVIKNLITAYNSAVANSYNMNYALIISVFTNITSRSKKSIVIQNIDLMSVIENQQVSLPDFLYLLRNIILSDTGKKVNEWFNKKKNRQTMSSLIASLFDRVATETERQGECYSVLVEVCALLSRDPTSLPIVTETVTTSSVLSYIETKIEDLLLVSNTVLSAVYMLSYIGLENENEEKSLLQLVLDNYTSFETCIEHGLPWFDFYFIENLLSSEQSNVVIIGVLAFEGCYKNMDNTFHTLKELLSSEKVKEIVSKFHNPKIKKVYDELVEKASKDESEEESKEEESS